MSFRYSAVLSEISHIRCPEKRKLTGLKMFYDQIRAGRGQALQKISGRMSG